MSPSTLVEKYLASLANSEPDPSLAEALETLTDAHTELLSLWEPAPLRSSHTPTYTTPSRVVLHSAVVPLPAVGFAAHRLQRLTLAGRHLSPVKLSPIQEERRARLSRQSVQVAPSAPLLLAPGYHDAPRRSLPWGSLATLTLIGLIVALAFQLSTVRF